MERKLHLQSVILRQAAHMPFAASLDARLGDVRAFESGVSD